MCSSDLTAVRKTQRLIPTAQARVPAPPPLPSLPPSPAEYLQARIPAQDPVLLQQAQSGSTAHARAAQHACSAHPPIDMRADLGQSLIAGCGWVDGPSAAHAPECSPGKGQRPCTDAPGARKLRVCPVPGAAWSRSVSVAGLGPPGFPTHAPACSVGSGPVARRLPPPLPCSACFSAIVLISA